MPKSINENVELLEELVDELQEVDEASDLVEAKHSKKMKKESEDEYMDEEEDEDEDEELEETTEDESIASVDKAGDAVKKKNELKAKAKPDADHGKPAPKVNFKEDLDAIIKEESQLSEGFREKAGTIFEAALNQKLKVEVERLEEGYQQQLSEEVQSFKADLVEKVDSYLDYVVEQWMKENELAVTNGLRNEIAENFMSSLKQLFVENYVEVPDSKVDLVDEMAEEIESLEEKLNNSITQTLELKESVKSMQREKILAEAAKDLAATEAEKLESLVEGLEFDSEDNYSMKVRTIKEAYFSKKSVQADEANSLAGEFVAENTDVMSVYAQAIAKFK
jgi:hypothetical protein